jgi:hypothetical protein
VIGEVGNYVIVNPTQLGNSVIADSLTCVDDQGWFEGSEHPAADGGVYSLCALCDRTILHVDMVIAGSAGRLRPHHADCFPRALMAAPRRPTCPSTPKQQQQQQVQALIDEYLAQGKIEIAGVDEQGRTQYRGRQARRPAPPDAE